MFHDVPSRHVLPTDAWSFKCLLPRFLSVPHLQLRRLPNHIRPGTKFPSCRFGWDSSQQSQMRHRGAEIISHAVRMRPYFCWGITGLSSRNGAKFRELSLNFPRLADWLCMGWPSCLAALEREFSNWGAFLLHDPVQSGWSG